MHLTIRITALALAWAIACLIPPALAHPGTVHVHPCGAAGPVRERTVTLPSGIRMTVRTTACRPVRHGDTTGVHVEVVR